MSDIFAEVEDELRAERTRRIFRRYGWVMALAAALVVVAAGVIEWRNQSVAVRHATLGTAMLDAMATADAIKPADPDRAARRAAAAQFAAVADQAGDVPGYRALARMRQAGLLADAGDAAEAAGVWDQVASDGGAEPLLRQVAAYQAAAHLAEANAPDAATRLDAIAASGSAYRPLAEEARAALAMQQGDLAGARAMLERLRDDAAATPPVANRARGLLEQLGSGH